MQVGKVSWGGQTFALARCSDSRGKKTRSRRTKEERRKMVESFIKRYRDSNNGNFPSLNLTHKEVGGSFYIVREIVREIIQENKVLRPGGLNLQAFNLDDCSEQHLPETFSSDHLYNLSLPTIEHSRDERKREASSFIENQSIDDVLPTLSSTFSDHDITSCKEDFALHSHDILVPQVIGGDAHEEQHCKSWHGNVDLTSEQYGGKLIELSGHGQNYLPTKDDVDEPCAEDKDNSGENLTKCEIDDPVGFSQPLLFSSTIGVSAAKDTKSDLQVSGTHRLAYSFVERENASMVGDVCDNLGNPSYSGHAGGSSPRHAGELRPLHFSDSTHSGSEQMFVEKARDSDTLGPTEASIIASKNDSCMPVNSEPTLNAMESLSSAAVDQKAAVVTSKSGRTTGEPGLENSVSNSKAGEKSTLDGTNRESSDAREKIENTEANPLLAIIKGLVNAFIKFWTE